MENEVIVGLENAVRFLAKQERRTEQLRADLLLLLHKGEIEEARDVLAMKWPIVQGTRNQLDLEKVGNQECDLSKIQPAIKRMLGQ